MGSEVQTAAQTLQYLVFKAHTTVTIMQLSMNHYS